MPSSTAFIKISASFFESLVDLGATYPIYFVSLLRGISGVSEYWRMA